MLQQKPLNKNKQKTSLLTVAFLFGFLLPQAQVFAEGISYDAGDVISEAAFVSNSEGSNVSLRELLKVKSSKLNVLYIFGGGDMGLGMPGHLWCQDSFEDTHILRSLVEKYKDQDVDFIPVAAAPVYHSQVLGAPAGVFLNEAADSEPFKKASADFISSSLLAFDDGILPLEPYFDLRFSLMLNRSEELKPGAGYGPIADWHGAFRVEEETQFYGVPSFWLISDAGEILASPFRGNIYHPHGGELNINYGIKDVDAAITKLLVE